MPAPFPLIKLGSILVKQISKPIANFAKERAKSHPFFRTYVCMPPAQFYNWCEVKLKMWVLNLGKPVNIPVLSEQMAIELGANLLGEGIVFGIAAGLLIAEYNRSANKEAAKEQARKDEISTLLYQLQELYFRVEQQDAQIREMHRVVIEISDSRKSILSGILPLGKKSQSEESLSTIKPIICNEKLQNKVETLECEDLGLVFQAVHMLEKEIINFEETERGNDILTNALNYIQNEVYRKSIVV